MSYDLELLCNPSEVAALANAYYGANLNSDSIQVTGACRKAAARFRSAIRHHLTLEEDKVITLDGNGLHHIRLPVLNPVVRSVIVDGEEYKNLPVSPNGMIQFPGRLPLKFGAVIVDLAKCGLEEVPPEVAEAVSAAAIVGVGQQPGVSQTSVGGIQVTYGSTSANGITEEWSNAVQNYQIRAGDRA